MQENGVIYYSIGLSTMAGVINANDIVSFFVIDITHPFIQVVCFIFSERKLILHIVQMSQLMSQIFVLMAFILGIGDAICTNGKISIWYAKNLLCLLMIIWSAKMKNLVRQSINTHIDIFQENGCILNTDS